MKTLKKILKNKPIFLHEFENAENVKHEFKISENYNILFASYGCDNYEGDAWVLFEENGKLYEVRASHCSCFGLEGQWEKDEVVLLELKNRLINGSFGRNFYADNEFATELIEFLGIK